MKLKSLPVLFYDAVSNAVRLDEVARIRQRPGFSTIPVHVGFVVIIVALRQIVLRELRFSFHQHSVLIHRSLANNDPSN